MARKFQTITPIDGSVYLERYFAEDNHIERTLASSTEAQRIWKTTSFAERKKLCLKVVEYFMNHSEDIGKELTCQMGRPLRYSPYEISGGFKERAEYMIEIAEQSLADIKIPQTDGFDKFIQRVPLGTVFVLAPWNYPYLTSVNAIIPAIMAGNTVILKHATQTPLCAERYHAAFEYAGFPPGVFQYLHLDHDQAGRVIKDSRIAYVAFTGSVSGGEAVKQAIGSRFIAAGMELGGKDPAYVRADANINYAVEQLVDGSFFNSGQSCCGVERIYVHEAVYKDFVDSFHSITKDYVLGNPLDGPTTLGPMVKSSAATYCRNLVKTALMEGAKSVIDPRDFPMDKKGSPYMAPQILIDVDHKMEVMSEETFGPIVGIMSVKDDDHAVRLMNDSQYGLTASVWTQDIDEAKRIGGRIETGTFFMNRCDYLDPALAWTGIKNSGNGCTLSVIGYEALTRPKSFHLKTKM